MTLVIRTSSINTIRNMNFNLPEYDENILHKNAIMNLCQTIFPKYKVVNYAQNVRILIRIVKRNVHFMYKT